jgi:hypothetical protein
MKIKVCTLITKSLKEMDRRDALKRAALTSAVIATLPNGAALANASHRQCIINDGNQAPSPFTTAPDHWLRVAGEKATYSFSDYQVEAVRLPDNSLWRLGDHPRPLYADSWEKVAGTEETIHLLVAFEPNADNSDLTAVGVYPEARIDNDYQGLSGSCMTSLSPAYGNGFW